MLMTSGKFAILGARAARVCTAGGGARTARVCTAGGHGNCCIVFLFPNDLSILGI